MTGPWTGWFPASQKYNDNEEYYIPTFTYDPKTNIATFELLRTWGSGWSEGHGTISLKDNTVIMYLDGDPDSPGAVELTGKVDNSSCYGITWDNGSRWIKQIPFIKYVHVIHMSHLDVGYDGINPTIGYINNVLNKYFQSHLPRSVYLSNTMDQTGHSQRGYIYTQHPWLLSMYLDCSKNFTLNSILLQCPSQQEVNDMKNV